jgi:hypothetical protein
MPSIFSRLRALGVASGFSSPSSVSSCVCVKSIRLFRNHIFRPLDLLRYCAGPFTDALSYFAASDFTTLRREHESQPYSDSQAGQKRFHKLTSFRLNQCALHYWAF